MKSQVQVNFTMFYEKWVGQLEEHVKELLMVSKEEPSDQAKLKALASKVTTHYKEYYVVKWANAHEDVLAFFSPIWLSSLENANSWMTGWKPSMAFCLVDTIRKTQEADFNSLADMSDEVAKKIEEVRVKVRVEEEKIEREMERQHVAMAGRRMVELAELTRRVERGDANGELDGMVEVALKEVLRTMEKIVNAADSVRLRTMNELLDVLSPLQGVDLLAAISLVHIHLRQWGEMKVGI